MKTIYLKVEVPDDYDADDHFPNVVFWSDSQQDYWIQDIKPEIIHLPTKDDIIKKYPISEKHLEEVGAQIARREGALSLLKQITE